MVTEFHFNSECLREALSLACKYSFFSVVPQKMRRSDLLQLMMDAQASAAAGDNMASLIAGDVAESIEAEKNATPGNPETPDARRHPSNRPKGLTDSEVLDNAFLLLLAGFVQS